MSDDLVNELQNDLEKERALLFLKKYGYYLLGFVVIVLLGIIFYNDYHKKNDIITQQKADEFFTIQHNAAKNPDQNITKISPDSPYYPLITQTRYGALVKDNPQKAYKILVDYANTKPILLGNGKNIPNFQAHILQLNALALEANTLNLADFEEKVKAYTKQEGAFKDLAYEFVITKAFIQKDYKIAQAYVKHLEDGKIGVTLSGRLPLYKSLLEKHIPSKETTKTGDKK